MWRFALQRAMAFSGTICLERQYLRGPDIGTSLCRGTWPSAGSIVQEVGSNQNQHVYAPVHTGAVDARALGLAEARALVGELSNHYK